MERPIRLVPAFLCAALILGVAGPANATDKAPTKKATTATKTEAKTTTAADPKADAATAPGSPPAAQPSQEEMMAMMMKLATPGPEHAALNPLVGSWKTVTKMWATPNSEPTVSDGSCERSWVLGGRYLVANYKGNFSGMPFEGMEVLGYDNLKKQYVSSWVDNMGTGIVMSTGPAMDPATHTYTLTGTMPGPAGKDVTSREVTNIIDGNTYTMTMFANDQGQDAKMMEITFTRK